MNDPHLLFDEESAETLKHDDRWWELMRTSFDPAEIEKKEVILRSLQLGIGKALTVKRDGNTIAMASLYVFHHPAVVYLTFIAVDPAEREHHIGSKLFEFAWKRGSEALELQGLKPIGMIWEVEDVSLGETDEEKARRQKRISFYEHLGGIVLPIDTYAMPPLRPNDSPLPMKLMFRPAENLDLPATETINQIIWTLFEEKYGAVNQLDLTMLERLYKHMIA